MVLFGLLLAMVGTDVEFGTLRFTFGDMNLIDGFEIPAIALGIFGIAGFMKSVNRVTTMSGKLDKVRMRDMFFSRTDLKHALPAMFRGTVTGTLCSLIPGIGPVIASFGGYAMEKRFGKRRDQLGTGIVEGVAAPEAATHAAIQGDFIPTMTLGIPGDAVMALMLGAITI